MEHMDCTNLKVTIINICDSLYVKGVAQGRLSPNSAQLLADNCFGFTDCNFTDFFVASFSSNILFLLFLIYYVIQFLFTSYLLL